MAWKMPEEPYVDAEPGSALETVIVPPLDSATDPRRGLGGPTRPDPHTGAARRHARGSDRGTASGQRR